MYVAGQFNIGSSKIPGRLEIARKHFFADTELEVCPSV